MAIVTTLVAIFGNQQVLAYRWYHAQHNPFVWNTRVYGHTHIYRPFPSMNEGHHVIIFHHPGMDSDGVTDYGDVAR